VKENPFIASTMTTACLKPRTILFDYPAASLLDEVLSQSTAPHIPWRESMNRTDATRGKSEASPAFTLSACTVGRCLHARDPLGSRRVLVEYQDGAGEEYHLWLMPLLGLEIAEQDEVLLIEPRGSREPIIVGIVASPGRRACAAATELMLAAGESLTITASNGARLLEIAQQSSGPVVKLCEPNIRCELPGQLRIDAGSIELRTHAGDLQLESQDEVIVRGDLIRLN
jgi:hypothetical protein